MDIAEIMNPKFFTISQDQPVSEAVDLIRKSNVGGLVVLDERGGLAGIVTLRDLCGVSTGSSVSETLFKKPTVICPETSIWEAEKIMSAAKVDRLPVVAGDILIGIVTKMDLLITIARHTDSLTGLYTAAYLRDTARRLLYTENEISIIFIDIDDFGFINKRIGHSEGDRCLCVIGNLLRRHGDFVRNFPCRFGGDEFALVSTCSLSEALAWSYGFRRAVENACKSVAITVSIGIAGGRRQKSRAGINPEEIIESLINLASLASTNAKSTDSGIMIADNNATLQN
ncbi:MAG: CBS domain-containing protein [Bacillota bacterium]